MHQNKKHIWGMWAVALLLFGYVLARAILLSFTHDESLTYLDFVRGHEVFPTANNHLLNTWLMKCTLFLFGSSEWSLRLPNVLAYLVYALFTMRIALELGGKRSALWVFLLLNVNPFLLDFFSLARGYGLSMSFLAMSLCFLLYLVKNPGRSILVLYATGAACLSILANLALVNYLVALIVILGLLTAKQFFSDSPGRKKTRFLHILFMLLPTGVLFVYILPWAIELRNAGGLYYGGNTGFWEDTVRTAVKTFLYYSQDPGILAALKSGVLVIFMTAAAVLISDLVKRRFRFSSPLAVIFMLLLVTIISTQLQHLLLGTLFLIERTALLFAPLFLLLTCALLTHETVQRFRFPLALPLLSVLCVMHFTLAFNFYYAQQWPENADIKPALDVLEAQRNDRTTPGMIYLGGEFIHEPCINYYRTAYHMDWLNKADRDGFKFIQDYFLVYDTIKYPFQDAKLIQRFPRGTLLLKNTAKRDQSIALKTFHDNFEGPGNQGQGMNSRFSKLCKAGMMEGLSYTLPGSVQELDLIVQCSVWVLEENGNDAVDLVIQFDHQDTLKFWSAVKINDYRESPGGWVKMSLLRQIPVKGCKGDVIKAYVWNNGKTDLLMDDLHVEITGIKP